MKSHFKAKKSGQKSVQTNKTKTNLLIKLYFKEFILR